MTWLKPLLNIVLIFAAALGDGDSHDETNPYRIDKIIRPLTYQITLQPFFHNNTFSGESEMYIHIKRPTKSIVMHAANMEVKLEKVYSYPHQVEHIAEAIRSKPEKQMIEIPFNEELIPGPYSIYLKFVGHISDETEGLFKTTYTDSENKTKSVLATYLRPTGARLVFPCWDEPAFKATFGIAIMHSKEYIALSNMPVRDRREIGNLIKTTFQASPVMSSYHVAFLVGQFIKQHSGLSNVHIYSMDTVSLAGSKGVQHLKYLSNLFETFVPPMIGYTENVANRSLMLPEIKNVILPTTFPQNFVENWGIAVYGQRDVILDEMKLNSMADKAELSILVARKLAYQGISSVVGPYWWTEIWLNEALTMFLAQITFTEVYRDNALKHYYEHKLLHEIYHTNIHNIDQKENEVGSVIEIRKVNIASSNFVKGYGLLRILERVMTTTVFRKGILEYLNRFIFASATIEEFWDSLQNTLDKSDVPHKNFKIKEVMNSWLTQKHYPILNMTRNPNTGQIIITQESTDLDERAKWWIPLYIDVKRKSGTTYTDSSHMYWLKPDEPDLKISEINKEQSFIITNSGNYRVNYDHMSWRQHADSLNSENYASIKVMNRAQMIDDAFYLTMNGRLDSLIFLKLIQYLHREKHYIPWYTFTNALSEYSEYWKLIESGSLKASLSQSFTEVLQYVEYEDKPADDDEKKFLRSLIIKWACNIGNNLCKTAANNALKELLKKSVSLSKQLSSMEDWTLCTGLMLAESGTWLEMLKTYNETKNEQLLIHLTCIDQPHIINNYISLLRNSERETGQPDLIEIFPTLLRDTLDDSTYEKIYHSILDRHSGKSPVLEYIVRNLEKVKPRNMSMFEAFIHIVNKVYSGTIINYLSKAINPKNKMERIVKLTEEETKQAEEAISNQNTTYNTMSLIVSKFKEHNKESDIKRLYKTN